MAKVLLDSNFWFSILAHTTQILFPRSWHSRINPRIILDQCLSLLPPQPIRSAKSYLQYIQVKSKHFSTSPLTPYLPAPSHRYLSPGPCFFPFSLQPTHYTRVWLIYNINPILWLPCFKSSCSFEYNYNKFQILSWSLRLCLLISSCSPCGLDADTPTSLALCLVPQPCLPY